MFHYEISGQGTPVIFIHGFMENTTMWHTVGRIPGIQRVTIDLFGHGKSIFTEGVSSDDGMEWLATKVIEIIDYLKFPCVQLVGHSLGGYVALEIFKTIPERVEHVTLLHSHPWEDNEDKKADRLRVAHLVQTKASTFIREAIPNLFFRPMDHVQDVDRYQQMALEMNPHAISWSSLAMRNRKNHTSTILEHPDRFTFVQGKYDPLIPLEKVKAFTSENNISLIVLENSAHMGMVEETQNCMDILEMILIE